MQGRIQDFKLGGILKKKLCRAEGGANIFEVFHVKNHDIMPKNHIFSNFRGACTRCAGSAPGMGEWCRLKFQQRNLCTDWIMLFQECLFAKRNISLPNFKPYIVFFSHCLINFDLEKTCLMEKQNLALTISRINKLKSIIDIDQKAFTRI